MSTRPTLAWAGAPAVIFSSPTTVNELAGTSPNITALAPARLVPVRVTFWPPRTEPPFGVTAVIAGAGWTSAASSISWPDFDSAGALVEPSNGGDEKIP